MTAAKGKPVSMHLEFYPIENLYGIEIEPFAVQIARLTIWMGHAQMAREMNVQGDDPLPLHNLDKIIEADALKADWPKVDAIIGNPPFIGSQHIRRHNGDDYIDFLKKEFSCGVVDLCSYWFRRANENLGDGQRAGLVGTNSISQNKARGASLDYIVANGAVITDAISSQDWLGEANVDVSIVNWVKNPASQPAQKLLDRVTVSGITSALRPGEARRHAPQLPANLNVAFQGCIPVGKGFILREGEASMLLADPSASYGDVVRPYLGSDEIANDPRQRPDRYIVDFGLMTLEDAMAYPKALTMVRERVKPERDLNRRPTTRERWWRYGEARPAFRAGLEPLSRYLAVGLHGKRLLFTWADKTWTPSNAVTAITRDDDWTFGIVTSAIHERWAREQSSTLEDRLRYTPSTSFETFPFPEVDTAQRDKIEQSARDVVAERAAACGKLLSQGKKGKSAGLTAVYNAMDLGAFADLRAAHRRLDEAVSKSYGWPTAVLDDREEIVDRLYELNAKIATAPGDYDPFGKGEKHD